MINHAWGENRILTFLPEARKLHEAIIKENSLVSFPSPRFISCWISEKCNLDCTYCYFSETNSDKTHLFIDTEKFIDWLAQAQYAGAESLEFSGGGEPTLHPAFEEIYERAYSLGYHLGLITHACNDMPLDSMVQHFKYIRCGLDAATAETHDAIKRNKRKNYWFHKAIKNIKEMVRLRDHKDPGCEPNAFTVGIKVVLNAINFHELRAMIELAFDLNVDYIQIKREHSSSNDLSNDQISQADEIIRSTTSLSVGIKPAHWINKKTLVKGTMYHARATTKCFMSPIHTVVTATGKILQCCFFESRPIGTIFEPFSEVWGSEKHRSVINMTTVNECDKVDCRWNFYNRRMKEVLEDPLAQSSFI